MPRQSSAALSTLTAFNPAGTAARLSPPAELSESERRAFLDIVLATKSSHFEVSDLPLLCAYVRAVLVERQAATELARAPVIDGDVSPWLRVHSAAIKNMLGLSMRLRLSPQARAPNNPTRKAATSAVSYYERMNLEGERREDQEQ